MTAASAANFHVVGGERTRDTWHYNYTCAGGEARPGELPWHVSMLRHYEGWHGCSAALLSCDPPIVVTAAHCVESVVACIPINIYYSTDKYFLQEDEAV